MGHRTRALMAAAALAAVLGAADPASAQTPPRATGRGWLFGATVGGGVARYPGSSGLGLELGDTVLEEESTGYGTYMVEKREARVVPVGTVTRGALGVVSFPEREGEGGFSFHAGYAFSRRLALLFDVGLSAGVHEDSFNQAAGSLGLRWSPAGRLWLQAGPANAQLVGHYRGEQTVDIRGGLGLMAAAGLVVVKQPAWELDVQTRYLHVPYDGFSSSRLLFAVGASRRPS